MHLSIHVEIAKKEKCGKNKNKICTFSRRTTFIRYVLYVRRPSVDFRVLLDLHNRYSGSVTVPPRRYSDSKMLTLRRNSSNSEIRKEEAGTL